MKFQSTPSAWRETYHLHPLYANSLISIHSLRMEGDLLSPPLPLRYRNFNPLPPHGGRRIHIHTVRRWNAFQSTPSAWRETHMLLLSLRRWKISIHSLRMEGDGRSHRASGEPAYFNPLPPHGGRRFSRCSLTFAGDISIHSLRMEGDHVDRIARNDLFDFNPLPPHGGRLSGSQRRIFPLP